MDGTKLQSKIYYGYAQSAKRIGLPFDVFRPTAAADALDPGYLVQNILASFNAEDMKYQKPSKYARPTSYCLADGRLLQVGDYMRGAGTMYFIAAMQPLLPILAVECNRVVTIFRPQQQAGVGQVGYGGTTAANETPLVTAFPASVLQGTKGEKNEVGLPGDSRSPWWAILLPNIPGAVLLRADDIVQDENGRRFVISSAEQTALGWRMTAAEAGT